MFKIYYFSATGNSLWSARKIMQSIMEAHPEKKCELINIGIEAQKKNVVIEADTVVFVFPSFAFGLPLVVRRFVKNAAFKTPYMAAFVTFGSNPLGTLGSLRRIFKRKNIAKMYFGNIPAVENYLAMFGTPDAKKIEERTAMQKEATEIAASSVLEQKENSVNMFYPFSAIVWRLFYLGVKIFYKMYRVSDKCSGCAVCEKICPVSAIVMKNGRPVFTSKCEHCQGCVDLCPLRAIQFGKVKFGVQGYCHPEIKTDDLVRGG